MATAVAVVAALASACCFAVAATMQHRVASTASASAALRPRLLVELAHRPVWVLSVALAAASYGIEALALAFGPLTLVAPLAATDLLFALPLIARRRGQRLAAKEWAGALCVAGGVAVFLTISPPAAGIGVPPLTAWVPVFAAVGGVVALAVVLGGAATGRVRAGVIGAAAAVQFGLVSALSKSFVDLLRADGLATAGRWEPYALLLAGASGTLFSQSAFQAGSLASSLPIIDTIEPISGVAIGVTIFDERLAPSTAGFAVQVLAAAVAVVGVAIVDRSPLADAGSQGAGAADPAGAARRPR